VKFGIGELHRATLSVCEFRENWYSGSHTSLKSVHEILPVFSKFWSELDQNLVQQMSTRMCSVSTIFVKIGALKIIHHVQAYINL
jgi:hypothetical protein